jgi:hypothetical protein
VALTLPCDTADVLELEEYLDHLATCVDFDDCESVHASASRLRALANNRHFLVERFNSLLARYLKTRSTPGYAPHSFNLAGSTRFYVRANVWTRPDEDPRRKCLEDELFSYCIPHDHNFSFLTVGYLGPGYETSIYEYDYTSVTGHVGERVPLEFLETTTLPPGKVMFYRASRDIHVQYPPPSLSISLNLMLAAPTALLRDQYTFDLERGTIRDHVTTLSSKRVSLLRMASYLGNGDTVDLLQSVARRHPCRRTRLTATQACVALQPAEAQTHWRRAAGDPEELVRRAARAALDGAPDVSP